VSSLNSDPRREGIEGQLARLQPLPGGLNRDELLFRAGQVSVRRRAWFWPAASASMTAVAAVLAVMLLVRPEPRPVERIVVVERPAPPAPETPSPRPEEGHFVHHDEDRGAVQADYLRLRDQVVRWGADALPSPPPAPPFGPAPDAMLELRERDLSWPSWLGRPRTRQPGGSL
jgi:hypothetical protein